MSKSRQEVTTSMGFLGNLLNAITGKSSPSAQQKPGTPPALPKTPVAASSSSEQVPRQSDRSAPPPPTSVKSPASKQSEAAVRGLTWFGPERRIGIAGVTIEHPLIYITNAANHGEPSAIDLNQSVARNMYQPTGPELGYWPQYAALTSGQRRYYLDWLAFGRKNIPSELGYTFLYIYGLERRALIDRADSNVVFDEIQRLRAMYAQSTEPVSRSFESYTCAFLWFLLVRDRASRDVTRFSSLVKTATIWSEDNIAAMLCWLHAQNAKLPDWIAYRIAAQLPGSQRSVVVQRVGNEFRKLFDKRFAEKFPLGMPLKCSKRDRRYAYRPASAGLQSVEITAPNPMGIMSQFNVLSDVWNECIADLKKLSSVKGSTSSGELTIDAWKAMPNEIRAGVDHPLTDVFCKLVETHCDESGRSIVKINELASLFKIAAIGNLTAAQSRKIVETAEDVGYGIEPDVRLTKKSYAADDDVIIFLQATDSPLDQGKYLAAACVLRVGVAIAAADGKIEEDEMMLVSQHVQSAFEFNDTEQRRLDALRSLLVVKGIDLSEVTRLLKKMEGKQRDSMSQLILALVAADGVITKEELKAVRKLYNSMGFDRAEVDQAIATLVDSSDDDPVTVAPAIAGQSGETIPPAPQSIKPVSEGIRLNRDAIAAIMKDTLEVAKILADAMNVDGNTSEANVPVKVAEPVPEIVQASVITTTDSSLPQRYAAFYQVVVTQPLWSKSELTELAKKHGLMVSGAVDAINDWATEKHGGPLLYEDGEQYSLETSYLN